MSAPPAAKASPAAAPDPEGALTSPRDEMCQVRTDRRKGQPSRQRDDLLLFLSASKEGAAAALSSQPRPLPHQKSSSPQDPPPPPPPPPPRDDLLAPGRRLAVVSTAAPPWMTGTAVNPTLRAAFLARELGCTRERSGGGGSEEEKKEPSPPPPSSPSSSSSRPPRVTLVVPWLNKTDQGSLFPEGLLFDSPREQEVALRSWVRELFFFFLFPLFLSFFFLFSF